MTTILFSDFRSFSLSLSSEDPSSFLEHLSWYIGVSESMNNWTYVHDTHSHCINCLSHCTSIQYFFIPFLIRLAFSSSITLDFLLHVFAFWVCMRDRKILWDGGDECTMPQYLKMGRLRCRHSGSDRRLDSSYRVVWRDRNNVLYCCYWLCLRLALGWRCIHGLLAGLAGWNVLAVRFSCLSLSVRLMHGWDCRYANKKTSNHLRPSWPCFYLLIKPPLSGISLI